MLDNRNVNHYIGYRETKVSFINLLNHFPGHAQCHTSLLATSSLSDGPKISCDKGTWISSRRLRLAEPRQG